MVDDSGVRGDQYNRSDYEPVELCEEASIVRKDGRGALELVANGVRQLLLIPHVVEVSEWQEALGLNICAWTKSKTEGSYLIISDKPDCEKGIPYGMDVEFYIEKGKIFVVPISDPAKRILTSEALREIDWTTIEERLVTNVQGLKRRVLRDD